MGEHGLSPGRATSQVVALINSRPVGPWTHEIQAIITRVTAVPASASLPLNVGAPVANDPFGPVPPELGAAFFAWDQARIRDSEELDDHEARPRQDILAEKT